MINKFKVSIEVYHPLQIDEGEIVQIIEMLKKENDLTLWRVWYSLEISNQYEVSSGLLDYFMNLKSGENRSIVQLLQKRVGERINSGDFNIDEGEVVQVVKMLKESNSVFLWKAWFSLDISKKYRVFSNLWEYFQIIDRGNFYEASPPTESEAEWYYSIIDRGIKRGTLPRPLPMEWYLKVDFGAETGSFMDNLRDLLEDFPLYEREGDIKRVVEMLKREDKLRLWEAWFSLKISSQYPQVAETFVQRHLANSSETIARLTLIFSMPHWKNHPQLLWDLIEAGGKDIRDFVISYVLPYPHLINHGQFWEYVDKLIDTGEREEIEKLSKFVLLRPYLSIRLNDHPRLITSVERIITSKKVYDIHERLESMIRWPHSAELHPKIVKAIVESSHIKQLYVHGRLVGHFLTRERSKDYPEILELFARKIALSEIGETDLENAILTLKRFLDAILERRHWKEHPRLIELVKGEEVTASNVIQALQERIAEKCF